MLALQGVMGELTESTPGSELDSAEKFLPPFPSVSLFPSAGFRAGPHTVGLGAFHLLQMYT